MTYVCKFCKKTVAMTEDPELYFHECEIGPSFNMLWETEIIPQDEDLPLEQVDD